MYVFIFDVDPDEGRVGQLRLRPADRVALTRSSQSVPGPCGPGPARARPSRITATPPAPAHTPVHPGPKRMPRPLGPVRLAATHASPRSVPGIRRRRRRRQAATARWPPPAAMTGAKVRPGRPGVRIGPMRAPEPGPADLVESGRPVLRRIRAWRRAPSLPRSGPDGPASRSDARAGARAGSDGARARNRRRAAGPLSTGSGPGVARSRRGSLAPSLPHSLAPSLHLQAFPLPAPPLSLPTCLPLSTALRRMSDTGRRLTPPVEFSGRANNCHGGGGVRRLRRQPSLPFVCRRPFPAAAALRRPPRSRASGPPTAAARRHLRSDGARRSAARPPATRHCPLPAVAAAAHRRPPATLSQQLLIQSCARRCPPRCMARARRPLPAPGGSGGGRAARRLQHRKLHACPGPMAWARSPPGRGAGRRMTWPDTGWRPRARLPSSTKCTVDRHVRGT